MSGFPARITLADLGPQLQDIRSVVDPRYELGARRVNTAEHTAVGCGLVVHRAVLIARYTTGWWVYFRAESWNTDGSQSHPTLTRTSPGVYGYSFEATYNDAQGSPVPLLLSGANVVDLSVCENFADRIIHKCWIDTTNVRYVQIRFWDASGTPVDPERFLLEVW